MTRTATTAATLDARAARIKLLLLDVDGVLTDGKILMHADGSESKRFDIKDGAALVWAQRVGLRVGLLSARPSAVDGAARGRTADPAARSESRPEGARVSADSPQGEAGRRRRGLHGRRSARSAGAGARRASRRRPPMPSPTCAHGWTSWPAQEAATARSASWWNCCCGRRGAGTHSWRSGPAGRRSDG